MNAVSKDLQGLASQIDERLESVAGEKIGFSLFVWTKGRAQYISNTTDRKEIKTAILAIIDGWDKGMPNIPAHEVKG